MGKRRTAFIVATLVPLCLSCMRTLRGKEPRSGTTAEIEVYVIPFSHLDLMWAGTREECLARGNRIIAKAIQIANQHPEFKFFLESDNFVANYAESHLGSRELDDFKRLVRAGRIEIAPQWGDIFQEFPPGEALVRNLAYGMRYAHNVFDVDPQVDHLGDIPGFTPQFPQLLREAGIPFMVMTRMGPRDKSLFQWRAPDGSRVLVWNDLYGYGWGAKLDFSRILSSDSEKSLREQLERVRATTPGPMFMTAGTDLWAPTADLISNIRALDRDLAPYRLLIATPMEFFTRVAGTTELPVVSGGIPSAWPNAETSILHLWQLDIPATNSLLTAEKFAAINYTLGYASYPQQDFDGLWRRLIESMDHNHDGQGGTIGDNRKKEYSDLAILRGGEILRNSLRNIAERVQIPDSSSLPIVVFNPLGWARNDVVKTHLTLYGDVAPASIDEYKQGLRLVDETGKAVPFHVIDYSENVSRALELVFTAESVPSLGYKTYYLEPAAQPQAVPDASSVTLDREKDLKDPRRPVGSDVMQNDFYRVTVDKATGEVTVFDRAMNRDVCDAMQIAAEEERGSNNVSRVQFTGRTIYAGVNDTALEENDPVRTVLRIDEQIDDIPIVQRLTLYKTLKRLDIENDVTWRGPRFINIEQLFPLAQPGAQVHYGVAFGAAGAGDVMPGAGPTTGDEIQKALWDKVRETQGWIFAGTPEWGLTLGTDHQIFTAEPGLIRANMIRGQRYTSVKIVRGDEVSSITYPPPGRYVFRYSLSSGPGDWTTARSDRAGMDLNNPLIPVTVVDNISHKSLPPSQSFCSLRGDNLIISALKKADSGDSIVLRFYETAGRASETPVVFLGRQRPFVETNLLERNSGRAPEQVLRMSPYQIKTIKLPIAK